MSKEKKWFQFNKKDADPSQAEDPVAKTAPESNGEGESTASIVEDVFREAKIGRAHV